MSLRVTLPVIACVLCCHVGCVTAYKEARIGAGGSGLFEKQWVLEDAVTSVREPHRSDLDLNEALVVVRTNRNKLPEEFWLQVANDHRLSDYRRAMAIFELLKETFPQGEKITKKAHTRGLESFLNPRTLQSTVTHSSRPIEIPDGQAGFALRTEFMWREGCAIYFLTSESIDTDELLRILRGDSTSKGLTIVKYFFYRR